MAAAVSPEVLRSLQAAVAAFPSSGVDNFYVFLGEATRAQVYVRPDPWVPRALVACSVIHGVFGLVDVALIAARVRAGNWGRLFRLGDSPAGVVIQPHVVQCYLVGYLIFAGISQGGIWSLHRLTLGDYTAIPASLLWGALVWIPLIVAVWCDLLGVVNAILIERSMQLTSRRSSRQLVRLFVIALYVCPLLLIVSISALAVPLTVLGTQPLVARTSALLAQIAALEPTWTGTVDYAALLPLASGSQSVLDAGDQYARWMRATYGLWSFTVVPFYLIWVPVSVIYLRHFFGQAKMLRGTVRALPSHLATASARSVGVEHRKDSADRRIRALLTVCWVRIITMGCITVASSFFAAAALILAIDPRALMAGQMHTAFSATSTCASRLALPAVPLLLIAGILAPHGDDPQGTRATGWMPRESPTTSKTTVGPKAIDKQPSDDELSCKVVLE